ncbi:MAG: hypothetical protein J6N73_00385 [Prevotella sp.]|nr:hypothetical protein [Prevotella sp.]
MKQTFLITIVCTCLFACSTIIISKHKNGVGMHNFSEVIVQEKNNKYVDMSFKRTFYLYCISVYTKKNSPRYMNVVSPNNIIDSLLLCQSEKDIYNVAITNAYYVPDITLAYMEEFVKTEETESVLYYGVVLQNKVDSASVIVEKDLNNDIKCKILSSVVSGFFLQRKYSEVSISSADMSSVYNKKPRDTCYVMIKIDSIASSKF